MLSFAPSLNLMTVIDILNTANSGTENRYEYYQGVARSERRVGCAINEKAYRHDPLERSRLSPRGPVEALEPVITPEVVDEEEEELPAVDRGWVSGCQARRGR